MIQKKIKKCICIIVTNALFWQKYVYTYLYSWTPTIRTLKFEVPANLKQYHIYGPCIHCKAWFTLATQAEMEVEATVSVQVRTDTTEAETEASLSCLVLKRQHSKWRTRKMLFCFCLFLYCFAFGEEGAD